MSKDKYPCIFSPQMATIVFIILQIFFATSAVLKIREYSRIFHSIRSRDAFRPIARKQKDLMDYNCQYLQVKFGQIQQITFSALLKAFVEMH